MNQQPTNLFGSSPEIVTQFEKSLKVNSTTNKDFQDLEKLYTEKKLNEAFFFLQKNAKANLTNSAFLKLSGVVCFELSKFDDAIKYFRQAKIFDKTGESETNLAVALIKINKQTEALKEIQEFSEPLKLNDLGKNTLIFLLLNHEFYDDAENLVKKFIKKDPKNSAWCESLARVYEIKGNEKLFVKFMKLAISNQADQKIKGIYYKKIGIYFAQKDMKKYAVDNYKKALQHDPEDKSIYRLIALVDSDALVAKDINTVLNDISNIKDDQEKSQIFYMLADIATKHKEYKLSGSLYDAAASFQRKNILENKSYDPSREIALAKNIVSIFGNYDFRLKRPHKTNKQRMIFVVGMPRSGTTLTESILAKHSKVDALGELSFLRNLTGKAKFNLNEIGDHKNIEDYCTRIMEKYLLNIAKFSTSSICVDKMPGNATVIGVALAASNETRVINLVRDPMAVAWSIYSKYFPARGMGFSFDKQWILNQYRIYLSMMDFWHQIFPGQIFDLNYERLTENQRESTERILGYCNLQFEEQCMEFYNNDRTVKTASAQQVKKEMYKGSSEKWRRFGEYLNSIQLELVEAQNQSIEKRELFHDRVGLKYLKN